jgi:hypothetical protein
MSISPINSMNDMSEQNPSTITVSVVDEIDNYKLYHYSTCDESCTQEIKESKGLIYRDNTLMCKSFSFTPEILSTDKSIKSHVERCISEGYTFYPSYEGTVLRMWCDSSSEDNKWFISTHKKIDAGKSRWGSKYTFRELFMNTLFPQEENKEQSFTDFTDKLNKEHTYTFLLRTSIANRIVCKVETNEIYYLGYFNKSDNFSFTSVEREQLSHENVMRIPTLEGITTYESFVQMFSNNTHNVSDCFTTQGILAVSSTGDSVKFLNPEYWRKTVIRGSEPNVLFRYIELKKQKDFETLAELKELFEEVQEFNYYEISLNHIKKNLLGKYIKRYISKSVAIVPPEQHRILCELYNMYLTDPVKNKLNMEYIENYLDNLDTYLLYNLYRQYQKRRSQYGNGNWVNTETRDKVLSSYYKEGDKENVNDSAVMED